MQLRLKPYPFRVLTSLFHSDPEGHFLPGRGRVFFVPCSPDFYFHLICALLQAFLHSDIAVLLIDPEILLEAFFILLRGNILI